jgi:Zn-dependent protease with chaperone function
MRCLSAWLRINQSKVSAADDYDGFGVISISSPIFIQWAPMRFVYPLLAVLAVAFFLASTTLAILCLAAVPFLVIGLVALMLAARQFVAAYRSLGLIPEAFRACFESVRILFGIAFNQLLEDPNHAMPQGLSRADAPRLFQIADEVAAAMGTRPVDRISVEPGPQLAVSEHGGYFFMFGTRRCLHVGVPMLYVLSMDEFRAVLGHEFGHFSRWHTVMTRTLWRFIVAMNVMLLSLQSKLNPLYWSTAASLAVLDMIYLPWAQSREYDVDRDAAVHFGSNHAMNALRKMRDQLPALEACLQEIVQIAAETGQAPTHLSETASRRWHTLTPLQRKRHSLREMEDVFDVRGKTHPPIARRVAALTGLPAAPALSPNLAAGYLPEFQNVDRDLTRSIFRSKVKYIAPREFLAALQSRELLSAVPVEGER